MQAKALGAPLSLKTLHNNFRKRDMTQKTFEEEMREIDDERELTMGTVLDITKDDTGGDGNEDPRQTTDDITPGPNTTTDN